METLEEIFFPNNKMAFDQLEQDDQIEFAHYTTAENLFKILNSQELWFRNVRTMNDLNEVEHGYKAINNIFNDNDIKTDFLEATKACGIDDGEEFLHYIQKGYRALLDQTYISCFSTHRTEAEKKDGRLSMWRAYGNHTTNVAVIINKNVIQNNPLYPLQIVKVEYWDEKRILEEIQRIIKNIKDSSNFLQNQKSDIIKQLMRSAIIFACVSLKHPGFMEEQEWRLLFNPEFYPKEEFKSLNKNIECISGVPQTVYKLPLNRPFDKEGQIKIQDIIQKILIGPCNQKELAKESLIELLKEKDFKNASRMVFQSEIPLRV